MTIIRDTIRGALAERFHSSHNEHTNAPNNKSCDVDNNCDNKSNDNKPFARYSQVSGTVFLAQDKNNVVVLIPHMDKPAVTCPCADIDCCAMIKVDTYWHCGQERTGSRGWTSASSRVNHLRKKKCGALNAHVPVVFKLLDMELDQRTKAFQGFSNHHLRHLVGLFEVYRELHDLDRSVLEI